MIKTTQLRQSEAHSRMAVRDAASVFQRVIEHGTNCSAFESQVVSQKALEVFGLGEYNTDASLVPGQIVWQAIVSTEPPGKPLSACVFKRVHLTLHSFKADDEVRQEHGPSAMRGQQILRMCAEAQDQGTLLTQEDLARLLHCDVCTVRRDITQLQQAHDILVPTRGNKLDIGPGITHRERVVEQFIRGKDPLTIARDMNHALRSVERYIQTFCRVLHCQQQLRNSLRTAMVVGVSVPLVTRYLDLSFRLYKTPEYKQRLSEIEELGSRFWECCDEKKTHGPSNGRSK